MKKLIIIISSLLLLVSCSGDKHMESALLEQETVCLKIKGKLVHSFDAASCQLGYNASKKQFRMGNDDMSEYFIVTCSDIPSREGQSVTATLEWTQNSSIQKKTGINFNVEKSSSDGTVWLWSRKEGIAAILHRL